MTSDIVRSDYLALLDTLRGVQSKYKQKYSFPSQQRLIELLREYHGITICRRTLNYWLKRMEAAGYIYRIQRHMRGKGGMVMRSTAYYICNRGRAAMKRLRRIAAYMRRLSRVAPYRVQKVAHNTFGNKTRYKTTAIRSGHYTELQDYIGQIGGNRNKRTAENYE